MEGIEKSGIECIDVMPIQFILETTQTRSPGNAVLPDGGKKAGIITECVMIVEIFIAGSQSQQALLEHRFGADKGVVA